MTKIKVLPDNRCPRTGGPVGLRGRDDEFSASAHPHAGDPVLPTLNQSPQRELDGLAAIPGAVELFAGVVLDADVVHFARCRPVPPPRRRRPPDPRSPTRSVRVRPEIQPRVSSPRWATLRPNRAKSGGAAGTLEPWHLTTTPWPASANSSTRSGTCGPACSGTRSAQTRNTRACARSRSNSTSAGTCCGSAARCGKPAAIPVRPRYARRMRSRATSVDHRSADRRRRRRRRAQRSGCRRLPGPRRAPGPGAGATRPRRWRGGVGARLRRHRRSAVPLLVSGQPAAAAHHRRARCAGAAGAPPLFVLHARILRPAGGPACWSDRNRRSTPSVRPAMPSRSPSSTVAPGSSPLGCGRR